MGRYAVTIIILMLMPLVFLGQSYNYVQYTTRDGLAGNMVYDMCQDKDGFLWFGTDNGLSRFDGRQFRNFTVKDGLPDNEVLLFYIDSKERMWISTFSNDLCYYYKGKFFNPRNDSNLARVKTDSRPQHFWDPGDGTVWVMSKNQVFYWPYGGSFSRLKLQPDLKDRIRKNMSAIIPYLFGSIPMFLFNDSLFYLKNGTLQYYKSVNAQSGYRQLGHTRDRGDTGFLELKEDIIHPTWQSDFPRMVGTISGAYEIDSASWTVKEKFLPGKGVAKAWVDFEGIYWFATQGDGVFKLASRSALTYTLKKDTDAANEIFSIGQRNDSILTGHGGSQLVIWTKKGPNTFYFGNYLPKVENSMATNRLRVILALPDGDWLLGFDGFLLKWNKTIKQFLPTVAIKFAEIIDNNEILVSTGIDVFKINMQNFKPTDTIWNARSTSATIFRDKYYIGTLSGLVIKAKNGAISEGGDYHPSLKRRIISFARYKKSLWVATSDSGLVEIQGNGNAGQTYSEKDGLSSNICRSLYIEGDEMWVGTNKGICKINLADPGSPMLKFNSFNLLPNDGINNLIKRNKQVLVGSSAGLTIFEESQLTSSSICRVFIDRIISSGKVWGSGENIKLPFKDNNLNIDFSGISMKSAGEMVYYYRISGLDDKWISTTGNRLSLAGIPSGGYDFLIYAVNKFGVKSAVTGFSFEVSTPFWKTYWFVGLAGLLLAGLVYYFVWLRSKKIHEKLENQRRIDKQLAGLEQKALQAQMNPHFIFNSLNSIQQYVVSNNVADANKYLSIFAALIRETLENSTTNRITLRKEVQYLTKYLELEQVRMGNTFDFVINLNGLEDEDQFEIPVMLLQPYVENSVRHGMKYVEGKRGLIEIDFWRDAGTIHCRIRDNGPGREEAMKLKSKQHIVYQSRGMEVTRRRVDILNSISESLVSILVSDVKNGLEQVVGTQVEITIADKKNEEIY